MPKGYQQIAYVTNDFGRALGEFASAHGILSFRELPDVRIPLADGGEIHGHYALAFRQGSQYELIQPLSGEVQFYNNMLPTNEFAIRFHHIGHYFEDRAEYDAAMANAKAAWPQVNQLLVRGGEAAYFDTRSIFGHYTEYFTFPPMGEQLDGVPRF